MPWKPEDALKHTHLASTQARQRQWSYVANGVLSRTRDEARAIKEANTVLAKNPSMKRDPKPAKQAPSHWSGK